MMLSSYNRIRIQGQDELESPNIESGISPVPVITVEDNLNVSDVCELKTVDTTPVTPDETRLQFRARICEYEILRRRRSNDEGGLNITPHSKCEDETVEESNDMTSTDSTSDKKSVLKDRIAAYQRKLKTEHVSSPADDIVEIIPFEDPVKVAWKYSLVERIAAYHRNISSEDKDNLTLEQSVPKTISVRGFHN